MGPSATIICLERPLFNELASRVKQLSHVIDASSYSPTRGPKRPRRCPSPAPRVLHHICTVILTADTSSGLMMIPHNEDTVDPILLIGDYNSQLCQDV